MLKKLETTDEATAWARLHASVVRAKADLYAFRDAHLVGAWRTAARPVNRSGGARRRVIVERFDHC
jgi:hypothetical protein